MLYWLYFIDEQVEWQLRVAAGQPLPVSEQSELTVHGHAVEARIYAENTARGFLPATGTLQRLRLPTSSDGSIRVDTGVREGVCVHAIAVIVLLYEVHSDVLVCHISVESTRLVVCCRLL
jgi:biotin carboxylase